VRFRVGMLVLNRNGHSQPDRRVIILLVTASLSATLAPLARRSGPDRAEGLSETQMSWLGSIWASAGWTALLGN